MEPIGTSTVARLLGVAPKTVRKWVADGTLKPSGRVADGRGALLFDRDAVIAFAEERIAAERARLDEVAAS